MAFLELRRAIWSSGQAISGPPEPLENWEKLRIVAVPANPNHYVLEWNGFPGRTYFIQVSHDLKTWIYLDSIRSGEGDVLQHGLQCNAESYFIRLQHTDIPTVNPYTDDFDGDGWSNADELALGGNPLGTDTDGDGYSDDYELANGGGVANPDVSPPPAILLRVQPVTLEYSAIFDNLAGNWSESLAMAALGAPPTLMNGSRQDPLAIADLSAMLDAAMPPPDKPRIVVSQAFPDATGATTTNLSSDQDATSPEIREVSLSMEHARVWLETQPLRTEAVQRKFLRLRSGELTTNPGGTNPVTTPYPTTVMGLDLTIPAGQRYSDPVDLSPENHTWILAEDEKRQVARDQIAKVGLEIWNGQYVHFESEPEPPPVEKKFEVGAFTVANLNDSDGDGKIDNAADETEVEFEDDLMRLRVTAGAGLEGKVRLVVKSGSIEFWTEKTKNAKIAQNDGKIEFTIPAEGLSKVIWIEATAKSTALRDIEIHADYVDENNAVIETLDKARATAIWAELGPRGIINGGIEVPEELDDRAANKTFNENLHSSWGVSKAVPPFNQFNYCVGIEFKVFPEGIGFEPGVHFDISRRKHGLSWVKGDVVGWVAGPVREFPVIADEPNDDIGDDDEDRFPSANLIYSLDNPAVTTAQPPDPIFRIVKRGNMVEYVRVKLGKIPIQSNNQLAGSRSSDFVPWHFRCDISRDPQGNWDFTQGHENVVASGNPPLGGKPQP